MINHKGKIYEASWQFFLNRWKTDIMIHIRPLIYHSGLCFLTNAMASTA